MLASRFTTLTFEISLKFSEVTLPAIAESILLTWNNCTNVTALNKVKKNNKNVTRISFEIHQSMTCILHDLKFSTDYFQITSNFISIFNFCWHSFCLSVMIRKFTVNFAFFLSFVWRRRKKFLVCLEFWFSSKEIKHNKSAKNIYIWKKDIYLQKLFECEMVINFYFT